MKVDKYILCFPKANRWAGGKIGVAPLNPTEQQVLYAIRKLGTSTNTTIIEYLRKLQNVAPESGICNAIKSLTEKQLIERANGYVLSPAGREYLALIRRYLVNVRL
jgi:DNA-binding MarR family transcriptional regulator